MTPRSVSIVAAGAGLSLAMAMIATKANGPAFVAGLERQALAVRDFEGGASIALAFRDRYGWITRHPILAGGKGLSDAVRTRIAQRIAAIPGVGGISWQRDPDDAASPARHCQDDVKRILETRSIRFSEASARIDPASGRSLDEVAKALRPCTGSIIAVTGYTDAGGDPQANQALSLGRAEAVRWALVARGLPESGLRTAGLGAAQPIPGLDPADPANRRIEFSVIMAAPVKPTPIDTPGPG